MVLLINVVVVVVEAYLCCVAFKTFVLTLLRAVVIKRVSNSFVSIFEWINKKEWREKKAILIVWGKLEGGRSHCWVYIQWTLVPCSKHINRCPSRKGPEQATRKTDYFNLRFLDERFMAIRSNYLHRVRSFFFVAIFIAMVCLMFKEWGTMDDRI